MTVIVWYTGGTHVESCDISFEAQEKTRSATIEIWNNTFQSVSPNLDNPCCMLRTDLITKLDQRQLPGDATSWPEHVVPSAGTVSKNWATFVSIAPHHPYPS